MGTRSRIAVMHGTVCKSVYCHWDGYLEHNGRILNEHYDSEKANELVALGSMSSLRPEIGVKHPFSHWEADVSVVDFDKLYGNQCTFYARDRGEKDREWAVAHTFDKFLEQVDNCGAEYYYVMRDGVWYTGCPSKGDKLVALAEALQTATEQV